MLTFLCFTVQRKTGECFGLNGLIFLGSILLWDYGLAPGMQWLLQAVGSTTGGSWNLMMLKGSNMPANKSLSLQASSLVYARGHAACCRARKTQMLAF